MTAPDPSPVETNRPAPVEDRQARFGLSAYHFNFLDAASNFVSFEGKKVLEVGGSLPRDLVIGELGAAQWVCVHEYDYWDALPDSRDLDRNTYFAKTDCVHKVEDAGALSELPPYCVLDGAIENLPESLKGTFDVVYSAAAFEHILNFPMALNMMHAALRAGADLFSCFSPIWPACNGHHLPEVVDAGGRRFNFNNSPIPNWGHLLLRPAELHRLLLGRTDPATAQRIVTYVYGSPHINRMFVEDYVDYVNGSAFTIGHLQGTFETEVPPEVLDLLTKRYPGCRHFGFNGLMMHLKKPDAA